MSLRALIRRHQVSTYFCLAYVISYGGFLVADGPKLLSGAPLKALDALLLFPVLVVGVGALGFSLTAVVAGRAGLRDLGARLGRWRVGARWYAVLFMPPALIFAVLLALSVLVSPDFTHGLFPLGIVFGLVPGFFEEIGWTGYALPRMLANGLTPLANGVILGVLWGLWHAPVVDYLGAAAPHEAYWLPFFLAFIALVAAIRVLIVWVYSNTKSLLLAQLIHASSTASLVLLSAPHASPAQEALWYAVYAAALWLIVALVAATYGRSLVKRPKEALVQSLR